MVAAPGINIRKAETSKLQSLSLEELPFGKYFTDHMLEADYEDGEWRNVEIKPYQPLLLDPSTAVIHYGQSIFEGLKAYKDEQGEVFIFRPFDKLETLQRFCGPNANAGNTQRYFYRRDETTCKP
jgi:branched-chain amino acid aminotransferase